jgi:erythromycin esterase
MKINFRIRLAQACPHVLKWVTSFISCLFLVNSLAGQESVKKFVQENVVQVLSISTDSTNYHDLEAVGNAIGDAKVVMLGEQDHGDATTFLAKSRLIKYLHEKKGFNVLAFESDFFGLNHGWPNVNKSNIDTFLLRNIYPFWTYCQTGRDLFFDYIPNSLNSSSPLVVTGFDCQMAVKPMANGLDSVIRKLQLPMSRSSLYTTEFVPMLYNWGMHIGDTARNKKYVGYLQEIKEQLLEKLPAGNFWIQVIHNLESSNKMYTMKTEDWNKTNIRDYQMAENLKWLNEVKYPNEKIIVWAANYHISKHSGHYPQAFMKPSQTMGTLFTRGDVMRNTYIMGFASYEGYSGRTFGGKLHKLTKPRSNSFENWIPRGYEYAFVDFQKFNSLYPGVKEIFYMSGGITVNSANRSSDAEWNKIFDGVFFIRTMEPCKK